MRECDDCWGECGCSPCKCCSSCTASCICQLAVTDQGKKIAKLLQLSSANYKFTPAIPLSVDMYFLDKGALIIGFADKRPLIQRALL